MIQLIGGLDFQAQHCVPPVQVNRTGDWHGMEMDAPDLLPMGAMQERLLFAPWGALYQSVTQYVERD